MKAEEHPLSQKPLIEESYGEGWKNQAMHNTKREILTLWATSSKRQLKTISALQGELLKAEQELEKKKKEHFDTSVVLSNVGLELSEAKVKIQELEETEKSLRKIQDQLLTKVRQLEDQVKYGFSEGTPQQHNKARIEELEETILKLKLDSMEESKKADR